MVVDVGGAGVVAVVVNLVKEVFDDNDVLEAGGMRLTMFPETTKF